MLRVKPVHLILAVLMMISPNIYAGPVDVGLGVSLVDASSGNGFEGGWDVQIGYEFENVEAWNLGMQLQMTRGLSDTQDLTIDSDMTFSSNALYLSARPANGWLYFKGGVVSADYQTIDTDQHKLGVGVGAGIVMGTGDMRLHLLDYQRFAFGADSFNMYTISLAIFLN